GYLASINPAFGVEVDFYDNSSLGYDDIPQDHIAIHENGDPLNALFGPVNASQTSNFVTDSMCHEIRFRWVAAVDSFYVWIDGGVPSMRGVYDIVTNTFAGNSMVYWGVTASTGNSPTPIVVCMGESDAFADAGSDLSMCPGDTVQLQASGGTTYDWTPTGVPGFTGLNTATPQYIATSANNPPPFTVAVTNEALCVDTDVMQVDVTAAPSIQTGLPDTICPGESVTLGGTPNSDYAYSWSPAASLNDPTSANPVASPTVTTTYTLVVTDTSTANMCSGSASVMITIAADDSVDITVPDTFVCNDGSIEITNTFTTPGVDFLGWTPSADVDQPLSANPTISPSATTTYYLQGLNTQTGCGWTDSITIERFDLSIDYWTDTTVCAGETVQFDITPVGGSGNYAYFWADNSPDTLDFDTISNPTLVANSNGTYTVMVTDLTTSCTASHAINVNIATLTVTATPPSELINPGQRVQLQAEGAMFYSWAPDTSINCTTCPDPVVAPDMTITYTVTGTDTNGCVGTATVNIAVDSFTVQNVFTPNGDGINDVMLLNYYGEGFYEISVFDRWGNQIFVTKDTNATWDGKNSNGEDVPAGVYYVAVRIGGDDAIPEKDKNRAFYITLMR
ncbi:MAG: gliding motility-associated C-terminal domain-containing protein, partial [Bacteroidota bacterium]